VTAEAGQGDTGVAPEPAAGGSPRHRWGLGAFVVVEVAYLLISAAFIVLFTGDSPPPAVALTLAVTVPTLSAAGLALLIARVRGNGPRTDFRMRWSWRDWGIGLVFGICGLFVTLPAAMLYSSIVGPQANSAVGEVFGGVRASWPVAVLVFVVIVVVAPICEEIVYRGLLWGALEQRWGRWVALGVSTVIFALAHLEFARFPLLLVVAIPIALARLFTNGLPAGIAAHQVTNLLPGIVVMLSLAGAMPTG
jgi:membrane protease YdiL (CAAX protease family)